MTRGDKLILGLVLAVALSSLGYLEFRRMRVAPPAEARVVVEVDGVVKDTFPLAELKAGEERRIQGPLGYSVIQGGENKVRMVSSPCPDKVCVQRGWISLPGEAIVCVPNRVMVHIEGPASPQGYDAVTQ